MLRALGKWVIVEPIPPHRQLTSALFIPETLKRDKGKDYDRGVVQSVGPKVHDIQVDDEVVFQNIIHWNGDKPESGRMFKEDGRQLLGVTEDEIYFTIEHDDLRDHTAPSV